MVHLSRSVYKQYPLVEMGKLVHSREDKPFDLGTYVVKTKCKREIPYFFNCNLLFYMHLVSLNV